MRLSRRSQIALVVVLLTAGLVSAQAQVQVGYAVIANNGSARPPVSTALFSYTNEGVLVTEAAVGATIPIQAGRIFVDESETQTGFALVNPSTHTASATLILRNSSGAEFSRRPLSLGPQRQQASYVSQLFPERPANFTGSLTFESDTALAAITLRESRNSRAEPLYTTLPVVDLSPGATPPSLVFPHIAAGGGYTTQLILVNGTSAALQGQVVFFASDGTSLPVLVDGRIVTALDYQIPANGTFKTVLDNPGDLGVGYAEVRPYATPTPGGSAIFQFRRNGSLVTEAGVSASPVTEARVFMDYVGTQTGVAIANPGAQPASVTLTLLDRAGAFESSTVRTLPARGHMAAFAHELFPSVASGAVGLIEIRSNIPVCALALKVTNNARNDLVLTTLPVADMNAVSVDGPSILAHMVIGGGFATRLILLNTDRLGGNSGDLSFFQQDGSRLSLALEGSTTSQAAFSLAPGAGRQYLPGNTNAITSLFPVESISGTAATEIAVNTGSSTKAKLRAVDSTGRPRDDFDATYAVLDTEVAAVDAFGNIQGKKAGFSTLTISARGIVATATVTVATLESGSGGFALTGITQDLARRLYVAAADDHAILVSQDLSKPAAVYAGVLRQPGLKNDLRLQSQFQNPSFLAINQGDGSLYISDARNHVIRRVQSGSNGRAETLAGAGGPGSRDGASAVAMFNSPQGVALDGRGNLWVVDSGNHTIRRINLTTREVQTIGGTPGVAGLADGRGTAARFRSPMGIAFESETAAQQVDRERNGLPPPPVRMIVADTGNGVLRRITETGDVTTISASSVSASTAGDPSGLGAPAPNAISFGSPTGVGMDPSGNIYVTDRLSGQLKTLLRTGDVVNAAQAGTFRAPAGVVISESGRVLVADVTNAARIVYGEPRIASVTPDRVGTGGGAQLTIRGSNFSPDTIVVIGSVAIAVRPADTKTIVLTAPVLPSGRTTLSVQNRGGLAQASLVVNGIPLDSLPAGYITTVVGGTTFAGDGHSALLASLRQPRAVTLDSTGNLFIADTHNHRVRKIAADTGVIVTVAGNGSFGSADGDGGPAIAATIGFPESVAVDAAGNTYVVTSYEVRKIDAATGKISTVARNLTYASTVVTDSQGNLFITDSQADRVLKVQAGNGAVTTVAGTGTGGYSGDGGPATAARLNNPIALAVDPAGNLYIGDTDNRRIRRVSADTGVISTVVNGEDEEQFSGFLTGLSVDASGNLFIPSRDQILRIDAATGVFSVVAGTGQTGFSGDGGPATAAVLNSPWGVTVDAAGNVWIADTGNDRIRKVDATTGVLTTVAGYTDLTFGGDNGPAAIATLNFPEGLAFDKAGNLFIADSTNHRVRRVDAATGVITTFAGGGTRDSDGIPATQAELFFPQYLATDSSGNVFISEDYRNWIRRVSAQTGVITTIAGQKDDDGFSGDKGKATAALLSEPKGIATDGVGNVYIADSGNKRIRYVNAATGIIDTGSSGFSYPTSVVIDRQNLFVADEEIIWKYDSASGVFAAYAGNGENEHPEPGEKATSTGMCCVAAMTVDSAGNLYLGLDFGGVYKISATTHIITLVTGDLLDHVGDGGPASMENISFPRGLAVNARGDLFISDSFNSRVRAIRGPIP